MLAPQTGKAHLKQVQEHVAYVTGQTWTGYEAASVYVCLGDVEGL